MWYAARKVPGLDSWTAEVECPSKASADSEVQALYAEQARRNSALREDAKLRGQKWTY